MKAILLALFTSVSGIAAANPTVATAEVRDVDLPRLEHTELHALAQLDQARDEVSITRYNWDRAVAAGHPVPAGKWAIRHFNALQARKAAEQRVAALAQAVRTPQISAR